MLDSPELRSRSVMGITPAIVFGFLIALLGGLMALVSVPAMAQDDEPDLSSSPVRLEEVVVEAVRQRGQYGLDDQYRIETSSFANLGIPTSLKETPFSVSEIDEDFLRDFNPGQLDEVAQYVPGVQQGNKVNNSSQVFQSRGFQIGRDSLLINGTQQSDAFAITPEQIVAGVEFIRGPASILNGKTEVGGAVNIITKKPLPTSFTRFHLETNDEEKAEVGLDLNRADFSLLGWDASGRLNLAIEDSESFRDHVERETAVFAPVLTLRPGSNTTLTLEANIIDWENTGDRGLPLLGGTTDRAAERFDESKFLLGTTAEQNDRNQRRYMVDASHDLNGRWTINFQFSYGKTDRSQFGIFPSPMGLDSNGDLIRVHFGTKDVFESLDSRLDLQGSIEQGSLEHRLVLGAQYREFERRDIFTGFGGDTVSLTNPDPNKPYLGFGPGRGLEGDNTSEEFFLQDQISVQEGSFRGVTAVMGGRLISFDDQLTAANSEDEFTPRAGLLYTPPANQWLTVYTNWSESFNPQNATDPSGNQLPPEEGEQYEVGYKSEFVNGDVLFTGAYFDLEKSNVAADAPGSPVGSIAVGKQENEGFEFSLVGAASESLNVKASYTINDGKVTQSTPASSIAVGNELQLTPDQSGSLWLRYDPDAVLPGLLPRSLAKNLTVAGGVTHVGDRFIDTANTIQLTSYERADLMLRYAYRDRTEVQLNLINLTDERYFTGGNAFGGAVTPGQPFTIGLNLTHSF